MTDTTFDPHTVTDFDYQGLRKERNYWFPHSVKYVAWFVTVAFIVSSSVVLIKYGMNFGLIKTYFWITAFLITFFVGILITAPIRILLFAMIDSIFCKKKPVIIRRKILSTQLLNPSNSTKKKQALKCRQYNANLYIPTPLCKLQNRFEDIKYNLELRNLTVDVVAYSIFTMTAFYIILINKPPMGFHNNDMILELILKGTFTGSKPFMEITTYQTLIQYLNETLFPTLLFNPADERLKKTDRRKKKSVYEKHFELLLDKVRRRQIMEELGDFEKKKTHIFDRGWTLNPNFKLIGKPRLRQIRVKTGTCKELVDLVARNSECAAELTLFNVETGDFSINWGPSSSKGLTKSQETPWSYQSAWKTATMPIFAKFSTYPAGGFVLELARNIDDARTVLEFLETFQWVDVRTRAVFIEFTVYCVNTNLFSIITLICEKSATGYIIPSYQVNKRFTENQIYTSKFLFLKSELEIVSVIMSVLFALLLFVFLLRESLRIHRTSFKLYFTRTFAVIHLVIIFFGILSLVLTIIRSIYVSRLLNNLEKANNNEFVSFIYAALWDSWSVYIDVLLICLAPLELFSVLSYKVFFFQLQTTLTYCYRNFMHLICKQIIVTLAFAFFFNLTLINYSEEFRNFELTLLAMIGRAVALDDAFNFSTFSRNPWFIVLVFFNLYNIIVSVLFVNAFIAVICLYFHKIRNITLTEKYSIFEYVKYLLTINRQKDLLHLKEEKILFEKKNPDIKRLKGGKNKSVKSKKTKIKCEKRKKKKIIKKGIEGNEPRGIMLKNFITNKRYNTTKCFDIAENRAVAMKNLMASFLTDDQRAKVVAREKALKALFWSFIINKANLNENSRTYFLGVYKSEVKVFDKSILVRMKSVVEDMGKEKCWVMEEKTSNEEIAQRKDNFDILEKKLSLLIRKRETE